MPAKSAVVIGMHRSGTSAVTRTINLLGLPVGRAGDLYSAPDNPSGHWESNSLCIANELVLSKFNGSFTFPPVLRSGWEHSPRADAMVLQLTAMFRDVYPTSTWLWKDPRTTLTLPLWRRILDDFCVVIVVRNPVSVVDSLHRRDELPLAYCHALWQTYNRVAIDSATGLPAVVVDFDAMMRNPEQACRSLAQNLETLGVEITSDSSGAAASIERRDDATSTSSCRSSDELWSWLQELPTCSERFAAPPPPRSPLWVGAAMRSARIWSLRTALAV